MKLINDYAKKVFDFCNSKYETVFTGSRAIGVNSESSDWDFAICVPKNKMDKLAYLICKEFDGEILNGGRYSLFESGERLVISIRPNKWFFGLFDGDTVIHIIIDCDDFTSINCWKNATEYCKLNPQKCQTKADRIEIFENYGVLQGYESLFYKSFY